MNLQPISAGHYIIGVSGGVDSVALLHALAQQSRMNLVLVVAHFDHGIRADSASDAEFVKELAQTYAVPFETERVELGANASEATARAARYDFLNRVKEKYGANAIITAHHQDDLIETAVLNMLRGTKRRGFVSLQSGDGIVRPLLGVSKDEILAYAQQNDLVWREDSTNHDSKYRRNHVRKIIKKSLTAEKRAQIIAQLSQIAEQNKEIDRLVSGILKDQPNNEINKKLLNRMQLAEAYEVAAAWLRKNSVNFDEMTIKRLVIGARTLENTAQIDLKDGYYSVVKRDKIVIERR